MKRQNDKLTIVQYPDKRLREICRPIERFDADLAALAERMFELMKEAKGVGLAAPQVGELVRLFVMNPTGEPADARVIVNPVLTDLQGSAEAEEGCLSIPGVNVQIRRATRGRLTAQDLQGRPIEMAGENLVARIWQHETDHLNGVLILDRMGPADRIATRKTLKALEEERSAR